MDAVSLKYLALLALLTPIAAQAPGAVVPLGPFAFEAERLGPGTVTVVPQSGGPGVIYPTIQRAVNAAVEGDTVLLSDGLFYGEGNRDVLVEGKNLTIRSENGRDRCVIDCGRRGRAFAFVGPDVTSETLLYGITIVRGNVAERPDGDDWGGGVVTRSGSLPTIEDCAFLSCSAEAGGGLFYAENIALPVPGVIRDCHFAFNFVDLTGGGLLTTNAVVDRCTIVNNTARLRAGGISASARTVVRDSLIAENQILQGSSNGGGVSIFASDCALANCTIVDNHGPISGGGVFVRAGTSPEISNCIVWGNSAVAFGDQIFLEQFSAPTINSCTVEQGLGGIQSGDAVAPIITLLSDEDPLFQNVGEQNYRLMPGSPSIDGGDPAFVADINEGDLDLFPRVAGALVDRGCLEFRAGLALSLVSPGRAGEENELQVQGARPRCPVFLFYSGSVGATDVSFGACHELTLELNGPEQLAVLMPGASGRASYTQHVPESLRGVTIHVQAICFDPEDSAAGCLVSNRMQFTYP